MSKILFLLNNQSEITLLDFTNEPPPNNNNDHSAVSTKKLTSIDCQSLSYSFNSTVKVGQQIFIFGSQKEEYENKYFKISIEKKNNNSSINNNDIFECKVIVGDINNNIAGGRAISVCYDGDDYIYLVCGASIANSSYHHRIDRFQLSTAKFEKFFDIKGCVDTDYFSFHYDGAIHSLPVNESILYVIDILTKSTIEYQSEDLFERLIGACIDDNGNIYMYSKCGQFKRFNLKTKEIQPLKENQIEIISNNNSTNNININNNNNNANDKLSLIYCPISNNVNNNNSLRGNIYLMGGRKFKNYKYSIEDNNWTPFFQDDESERSNCGSCFITL
ncbi:hypothetical protein PPL_02607 [Heterostelium album PN500]|uniref:Uncharacterized protein n=1 Tax=Heterostelium pallidum (strain ATCC 26659 / Pp 5 / PN500) TaxID=670386 RepID=D3B2J4_HETP5|nr:hypothetical protein PPL_02607 [Heterostelium album PN500]EFA83542.1 hypothetical protein PPL_02607 [Heterostelium album PN500]|eukprot:XP_020435659.1 hypothetical protein PPL_02607 [Heterostelium album PN500]